VSGLVLTKYRCEFDNLNCIVAQQLLSNIPALKWLKALGIPAIAEYSFRLQKDIPFSATMNTAVTPLKEKTFSLLPYTVMFQAVPTSQ